MTEPSSQPPQHRSDLHPHTVAVTVGRPEAAVDAPLNPPVVFASTYVAGATTDEGRLGYGRYGNPTWSALEDAIGALEGGRALTFASGMAAAYAVLELVPNGATVVLPRHCYLGVAAAIAQRAERLDWTLRSVDVADTAEVLAAAAGADLVWMESPTNPMIEVADLPAIGAGLATRAGSRAGAAPMFVVDNTFATPMLQQPLACGATIVLHSGTKLIAGHSDVLLGALVTRTDDDATFAALDLQRRAMGASPGPMEAYLALRGLRTLPLRQAAAQANAQILAERLLAHPAVSVVRYPGLVDDPGHATAARTMSGFGSLVSIELADAATADAMVARCRLWVHATSLGGVESTLERRRRWGAELPTVAEGLVRLSVGIEHVDDLWADLRQALG